MKEKKVKGSKQTPISPPVLIVGVLAVVAVVYLQFFTGSSSEPQSQTTPEQMKDITVQTENLASVSPNDKNLENVPQTVEKASVQPSLTPQLENDKVSLNISFPENGKDPFLLPGLVQRSRREKDRQLSQPVIPQPVSAPAVALPKVNIPKVEPQEEVPTWKGIIKTNANQLAIIGYSGHNYLLHNGDKLLGTEYRLVELNTNYLILESPSKQLKLQKKGERK